MSTKRYPFQKDDGSIVWVDFDQMMEMDAQGFLQIDGELTRRARSLEPEVTGLSKAPQEQAHIISDSLGFIEESLPEQRAHLERTGIRGIEFVEDPDVPRFYQVHCTSEATKMAYANSRGLFDRNSRNGSGGIIGESDIRNAEEMIRRKYDGQSTGLVVEASPELESIT